MIPHFLASLAIAALLQPGSPAPTAKPNQAAEPVPPAFVLGVRVTGVRERLPVAPVVVIVSDLASYVSVVGQWRVSIRYPVLFDDGTTTARENIGRFVRAFSPTTVVRWSSGGTDMKDGVAVTAAVDGAVGKAWTVDGVEPKEGFTVKALLARFAEIQLSPPGVVVAAKDDPAWTAALALAAGHGQPIFWTTSSRRLDSAMSLAEADAFEKSIEDFCTSTGLEWKRAGDVIEAVSLCMATPASLKSPASGVLAMTDRIGRQFAGPRDAQRWAWCGQIPGTHSSACYMAMCSLFLPEPRTAWLFDSYPTTGDWNTYDCTAAGEFLGKKGIVATVTDNPNGNEKTWRQLITKPVDAGLIMVNTKGNKEFFDLSSGQGKLGDVPVLNRPSAVYFVHSWSAQYIGGRDTLAARWLERGVAFYTGSMEEPNLSGFVPTPNVALREAAGMPMGAAVRYDDAPVWKITAIGDPLMTIGKRPPAAPIPTLPNAIDLSEAVKAQVKSEPALAICTLVVLGRDEDAARLLAALIAQGGNNLSDAVAAGGLALFRTGRTAELLKGIVHLRPAALGTNGELVDAAWAAAGMGLATVKDRDTFAWFAQAVRPEQLVRDLDELATGAKRAVGAKEALLLLQQARDGLKDPGRKAEADKALLGIRSRIGG